jgi:hypothetical protein
MPPKPKRRPPESLKVAKPAQKKLLDRLKNRQFNIKTVSFLALIGFAFLLNISELNWGLSGYIPWSPDAIEGEISINHLPLLFKQWQHKYPRGQFFINWLFYNPLIKHWSKNPVSFKNSAGENVQAVMTTDRARYLASISRWITAAMSIGTVIAVFVLTQYLFGDYLAGWFAGLALATSCLFLFYSGFGHIDVPFTFWFAWACVFIIQAGLEHKWSSYILGSLCAGYALCTKEGYFGYLPGLAIVYCVLRIADQYHRTNNLKKAVFSVFSLKVFTAIGVFVILFLVMNGFFNFKNEFFGRMEYWKNDETFQHKRPQLFLLREAAVSLYTGLGWPLLLILVIGIFYLGYRYPRVLAFVVIPVIVFYLITVPRIYFVAGRFFIPAYVCFAAAVGKTLADWVRFQKVPILIRYIPAGLLMGLTVLFCVGLKLEMRNDTRNRAEAWFEEHVDKTALIGSGMKRWYAPRLTYNGFRMIDGWHSEGVPTAQGTMKLFPEYLIMSTMFPCSSNYKDDSAFKEALYKGQAGYKKAATFEAIYFSPGHSIFSIACRPYAKPTPSISPTIDIFQKEADSASRE